MVRSFSRECMHTHRHLPAICTTHMYDSAPSDHMHTHMHASVPSYRLRTVPRGIWLRFVRNVPGMVRKVSVRAGRIRPGSVLTARLGTIRPYARAMCTPLRSLPVGSGPFGADFGRFRPIRKFSEFSWCYTILYNYLEWPEEKTILATIFYSFLLQ